MKNSSLGSAGRCSLWSAAKSTIVRPRSIFPIAIEVDGPPVIYERQNAPELREAIPMPSIATRLQITDPATGLTLQ